MRLDNEVSHHEAELSQMFDETTKMKTRFVSELAFVSKQVETVAAEVAAPGFEANALVSMVNALKACIVTFENHRNLERSEIERL